MARPELARSRSPMTVAELAERLGITPGTLRDTCDRRVAAGMPAPISPFGHRRWERRRIEAWLAGHATVAPANDAVPIAPETEDQWHRALAETYGGGR